MRLFAVRARLFDEATGWYVDIDGMFEEFFTLHDYPYGIVYLSPAFSRFAAFEDPLEIKIR